MLEARSSGINFPSFFLHLSFNLQLPYSRTIAKRQYEIVLLLRIVCCHHVVFANVKEDNKPSSSSSSYSRVGNQRRQWTAQLLVIIFMIWNKHRKMTMSSAIVCHRVVFSKCEKGQWTKLVILFMFWNKHPKTTMNNAIMLHSHIFLFVCLMKLSKNDFNLTFKPKNLFLPPKLKVQT